MKLAKSLLLGSAAGLAVAAGAQAADLPVRKAAAVEYVRVCSTYGAGFFYIPGTETCLRVSGRVRAEYRYLEPFSRAQDAIGFRARGRLNLDARTATAYGLLRAYARFEITRNSGVYTAFGQINSDPQIQQAFIQFGGLTAGRVTSFFSNPDLPTQHMGTLRFDDAPDVTLLAYTYSFGNGFSATLSMEDGIERRNNSLLPFNALAVPGVNFPALPFVYGGERMPDVVANVRYAGTWGGVQLSGAVHQIREIGTFAVNPLTGVPLPVVDDSDYGFAVGLSGYVNLPVLGAGDAAWVFATYTDGATAYINGGQSGPGGNASIGSGPFNSPFTDAVINPFTGDFKTTRAWSIAGGITHNWTPEFRSSIFGSYARWEAPSVASFVVPVTPATLANGTAGSVGGLFDFNEYRIGANSFWSPIAGLNLGVEVLYTYVDPKNRVAIPITDVTGVRQIAPGGIPLFKLTGSEDIWEGRLRVQRDF
jgi:Porin subfamily